MSEQLVDSIKRQHVAWRKIAAVGIAMSSLIGACGNDTQSADILPLTTYPVITDTINNHIEIVPVTTAVDQKLIDSSATADSTAVRLNKPKKLDCSNARMVVFGNSVDSLFGVENRLDRWQANLQDILNFGPFVENLKIIDKAVPGSGILSPTIYQAPPMTEYVKTFLASYKDVPARNTTVIIDPSYIEMTYFPGNAKPIDVAARAFMGVKSVVELLKVRGFKVVVIATTPITDAANKKFMAGSPPTTTGDDTNAAIKYLNDFMYKDGLTPKTMKYSPLANPDGSGKVEYFDGVAANSLAPYYAQLPGGDGLHFDPEGQQVLGRFLATVPEIKTALDSTCKVLN